METTSSRTQLINFLLEDLAIPADALAIALRHHHQYDDPLPMVLWKYGLITLEQLERIFDWQETA